MKRRLVWTVAAAVALGVAASVAVVALDAEPSCGCTIAPYLAPAALETAESFRLRVASDDLSGAWAMLTPAARVRYGDLVGFRRVAARLRPGYRWPGGWAAANEWIAFSRPSELVVARYVTSPLAVVSAMVVHLDVGDQPDPHVDPEPVVVPAPALPGAPYGVRARLPDAGEFWPRVAVVDATGSVWLSSANRENLAADPSASPSPGSANPSRPSPSPSPGFAVYSADTGGGRVLVVFAHRTAAGWHVSVVTTTARGRQPRSLRATVPVAAPDGSTTTV